MTTLNTFKTIIDALADTMPASSAVAEDIERFVLIDGRRRYATIDPPLGRRKRLKQSRTTHTHLSFLVLMLLAIMTSVLEKGSFKKGQVFSLINNHVSFRPWRVRYA